MWSYVSRPWRGHRTGAEGHQSAGGGTKGHLYIYMCACVSTTTPTIPKKWVPSTQNRGVPKKMPPRNQDGAKNNTGASKNRPFYPLRPPKIDFSAIKLHECHPLKGGEMAPDRQNARKRPKSLPSYSLRAFNCALVNARPL